MLEGNCSQTQILSASPTQSATERKSPVGKGVSFGDLPSSLANNGGCILQGQGEAPRDSCKVGKLARLVLSKASCIASEFDELLDAGAWSEQVRVATLGILLPVVASLRAFPMRLLWLARARPS